MAKKARSTVNKVKPLTQRPLDLIYVIFFVVHFLSSFFIDLLPLWPAFAQTAPGLKQLYAVGKWITADYLKKSNDPFILSIWNMTEREWEFSCMKVFMWMEVFIQMPAFIFGTYGLYRGSKWLSPYLFAYATAAIVTTSTYMYASYVLPTTPTSGPKLEKTSQYYSLSSEQLTMIMGATTPFLIIPAIMWVDMLMQIRKLMNAGERAMNAGVEKKTD